MLHVDFYEPVLLHGQLLLLVSSFHAVGNFITIKWIVQFDSVCNVHQMPWQIEITFFMVLVNCIVRGQRLYEFCRDCEWPVSRADSTYIASGSGQWPDGSACALPGPSIPHRGSRPAAAGPCPWSVADWQSPAPHDKICFFLHCVVVASHRPVSVFNMDTQGDIQGGG